MKLLWMFLISIVLTSCADESIAQTEPEVTIKEEVTTQVETTKEEERPQKEILSDYYAEVVAPAGSKEEIDYFDSSTLGTWSMPKVTTSGNANPAEGKKQNLSGHYLILEENDFDWAKYYEHCHEAAWVSEDLSSADEAYVEFSYTENPGGISSIQIINGYGRDKEKWEEHGRVKTMAVYVNGEFRTNIHFIDTMDYQKVKVRHVLSKPLPLTYRFVVTEIYEGSKYNDVALTFMDFVVPT